MKKYALKNSAQKSGDDTGYRLCLRATNFSDLVARVATKDFC
jgi:hypothetical protein